MRNAIMGFDFNRKQERNAKQSFEYAFETLPAFF